VLQILLDVPKTEGWRCRPRNGGQIHSLEKSIIDRDMGFALNGSQGYILNCIGVDPSTTSASKLTILLNKTIVCRPCNKKQSHIRIDSYPGHNDYNFLINPFLVRFKINI